MNAEQDLAVTTLAAAIIGVRGSKRINEIATALEDARFLLYPPAGEDLTYQDWQARHGQGRLIRQEDDPNADRLAAVAENLRRRLTDLRSVG